MSVDIDHLKTWIGKTESTTDVVTPVPVAALSATLDRDDDSPKNGDALPPLWHWLYFLPVVKQSELGPDGHPKRGGFLPPVELPRRMWAGGRLTFHQPLRIGDTIARVSTVAGVTHKAGRSGDLVFVLAKHEISNAAGLAISEEHDIVYRDPPRPGDPAPKPQAAPAEQAWLREVQPDDVFLFRYSALIFNAHRIHYDRRYVTGKEGYPGLIVHGPLIATLLLDLLRRKMQKASVASFSFRAIKPLFDLAPFYVCGMLERDGKTVHLWAKDADGWLTMDATAKLS